MSGVWLKSCLDTTGSSPKIDPQAANTAPENLTQNPYIQIEGGFLAGS